MRRVPTSSSLVSVDDDEELLTRWREGDDDAGNVLVIRYVPQLTRFFLSHAGDHTQDLVQTTLHAMLRPAQSDTVIRSFRAYLFAVARSQLLMWIRRISLERRSLPLIQAGLPLDPRSATTPSAGVGRLERRTAVQNALESLPLDFQVTVKMHYWHDLTLKEVATATGVSVGTVKSRLSRARARLATALAESSS